MKNTILLLLALFTFLSSFAQSWTEFNLNTTEQLNEIHFTSDDVGHIVGGNGLILRTIDGGDTWTEIDAGVSHNLMTIAFVNNEIGYINGLKTIDGGATWSTQASSEIFGLMYSVESNKIIAGHGDNFNGDIFQSVDGGETWEDYANPVTTSTNGTSGMYNDCFFVTETEGYLATWYSNHLFKTIDAGLTWDEIVIDEVDGTSWFSDDFRSVYFPSKEIGLVTHEGGILKTTDAGITWSEIRPDNFSPSFYPESVIALSTDNYILVGRSSEAAIEKIYETMDGGASWTASIGNIEGFLDVECTNKNCFAVGTDGAVYKKETVSNNKELIASLSIKIYPNPAQDLLTIENSGNITEVKIFSLEGKLLDSFPGKPNGVDITNLNPGIYLIEVHTDGIISTSKFIKK